VFYQANCERKQRNFDDVRHTMIEAVQENYTVIVATLFILVAGALVYAAFTDLKNRIIKNKTSLFIALMFIPFAALTYANSETFNTAITAPAIKC
jgi:Flp pilus assembly protein protease CpaA